jgi:hypothetical protein
MDKERLHMDLWQDSLKQRPFSVPEGYFQGFAGRLQERILQEEERKPVRRMGTSTRFRVAMAAALAGLALITYSVIRFTAPGESANGDFMNLALMEQLDLIDDDSYLIDLMEESDPNEEDAYATQVIEFLAINDVEIDLIFE